MPMMRARVKPGETIFQTIMRRMTPVIKPERVFGAVWTSDKVAQHRPVMMCESCWRRYSGWWKKADYRPDWGYRYTSDCDGCSTPLITCTLFHYSPLFHTILTQAHGRQTQPY